MQDLILTEINVFPIKSLGGVSLSSSVIEKRGLKHDRRWMLVDQENNFITQRKYNILSLLKVNLFEDHLEVSNDKAGKLKVYFKQVTGRQLKVNIWNSICDAVEVSIEANEYFSNYLDKTVALVYMPDESLRFVDRDYAVNNEIVGFADAFPFLLIGKGSLNQLNSKLEIPVLMDRFRPNIVVNTPVPFDEDNWIEFSIGNANFMAVKPCSRCVMTMVDQKTGIKGEEPLRTLSSFRTINNKVMFGQNVLFLGGKNYISLTDQVVVKSRKQFL